MAHFIICTYSSYVNNKSTFIWRQILTLNLESTIVVDIVEFDSHGRLLEHIDLQGLPITATSLSWPPYISIDSCNNIGTNCSKSGYLVEFMDIWARELNFTWDIYEDVTKNWGLNPIEGKFVRVQIFHFPYFGK